MHPDKEDPTLTPENVQKLEGWRILNMNEREDGAFDVLRVLYHQANEHTTAKEDYYELICCWDDGTLFPMSCMPRFFCSIEIVGPAVYKVGTVDTDVTVKMLQTVNRDLLGHLGESDMRWAELNSEMESLKRKMRGDSLKCPKCGGKFIYSCLASNPPQYEGECRKACGFELRWHQREHPKHMITQEELDGKKVPKLYWEKNPGVFNSPSIGVTDLEDVVIDVGGVCFTRTLEQWHALAKADYDHKRFVEVLDKVAQQIIDMPQEEYEKELEKHKDGDIAKIIREMLAERKK